MPPEPHRSRDSLRISDAGTLDAAIEDFLATLPATPGLAVGLIRPEGLYAQGFGYRDLTSCEPVTTSTGFYLLSVTKSFTGMLAALLQHEGEIELEWNLQTIWPELDMPAPINPAQITLRDLLLHAPGFDNGGINYRTYLPGNLDNRGVVRLLAEHSLPTNREFAYRNTGYVVAATAIESVLGSSWRELLIDRLFEPLGLTDTTPYIEIARQGEFALPYAWTPETAFDRRPVKREPQMHAAGGVVSSVDDLTQWIRLMLGRGEIDGERYLPTFVVDQALAPQIQLNRDFYRFSRFAYGLGVYLADYEGDLLIHHFGGPIHVSFMPEHEIGVVVLSNGTGPSLLLAHMIATYLYDYALGKPDLEAKYRDEIGRVAESTRERIETRAAALRELLEGRTAKRLTHPADSYVGTFRSDRLGDMVVAKLGDRLLLTYGVVTTPMIPYAKNRFMVQLEAADLPEIFEFRMADPPLEKEPRREGGRSAKATILDWDGRVFERIAPNLLEGSRLSQYPVSRDE